MTIFNLTTRCLKKKYPDCSFNETTEINVVKKQNVVLHIFTTTLRFLEML